MKKPIVSVARNEDIASAVNSCLDQLEIPNLTGKTVLLKPNVGREEKHCLGINTNPKVVGAIFSYLKKRFKANYLIGDSPIINTDTKKAFELSGYSDLLSEDELHFINLDDRPPIELEIPQGKILKKIKVTGYLNDIDYLISIPVCKMHMHTGASLSFKNLKGLIYKRNKVKLHHLQAPEIIEILKNSINKVKELDVAISDLAHVIHPDLAIIDASYAQEGMGPSSGDIVNLNTIIASTNYLAADTITLALTRPEWSLKDVPHLKLISELKPNIKFKYPEDIITIPENIQKFVRSIKPPPTSISIKYENVRLIDVDSCSACLSTIFNLLKNNKDFINNHFTSEKPLNLAIGKGIKQSDLYTNTFLVGNCTANNLQENNFFVQGCTPVESTIIKTIKESLKLDLNK